MYKLGFSLVEILYYFVIVYTAYAVLVVPITKITSRIGYKHAILVSSFVYVLYWIIFYQIKFHPIFYFIAPVLFAIQKCFYWPPYNADIAIHAANDQRGREVGVLFSLIEMMSIVAPLLGGFLSYQFGFPVMFILAGILMIASVVPLFQSPDIYTRHRFSFKNFFSVVRRYPRNFFAYWGYAEDLMLQSLWPIFVFLAVPYLFSVGIITTVASLIAVVVMLYLGKLLDEFQHLDVLPVSAVIYGLTWLFRFICTSLSAVVGFDIATRIGKGIVNVPMETITYEIAGDAGPDHAIAYTVFYEFSLSIGKIFTALLGIWILSSTGQISYVFILAGVLTMFYGLLRK